MALTQMAAPGIHLVETLRPSMSRRVSVQQPAPVLIGESPAGPAMEPTLITNWREFYELFGGFGFTNTRQPMWLSWGVYQHFQAGGSALYVIRVIGQNGVQATVTVPDQSTEPIPDTIVQAFAYPAFEQPDFDGDMQALAGDPGTFILQALSSGVSGNYLTVIITDSPAMGRFDAEVIKSGVSVERWTGMSMNPLDGKYFPAAVNAPGSGSMYINVDDRTTSTFSRPADGLYSLRGGADGQAVTTSDYLNAVNLVGAVEGSVLVAAPGNTDPAVQTALVNHCESRTNGFAILDGPNDSVTAAISHGASLPVSSYGAVYYPWPVVTDASANRAGATRAVPPSGSVMGLFQRNDLIVGPQEAAAGSQTVIPASLGLSQIVTLPEYGFLNDAHINGLRMLPGSYAVNLYGVRTLRRGYIDQYINVRRSLIYIKQTLLNSLQFAVFRNNDAHLWAQVTATVTEFLRGFWLMGGLRGFTVEEAFFVLCDETNNSMQTIETGELHVDIGVALQTPAEFIIITIGLWEGGATAEEQEI